VKLTLDRAEKALLIEGISLATMQPYHPNIDNSDHLGTGRKPALVPVAAETPSL